MTDEPPQPPHEYSQEESAAMSEELHRMKEQYNYDNEWISFLAKLAENDSTKDIVDFINQTEWTDRQKKKVMAFSKIMLGRGLSTTYITGITDYRKLQDDFTLVECDLTLGMTVFDITPEFHLLVDMIKMHFGIETRRSKGGHFIERLGTQRTEFVHETHGQRTPEGFKEKIWKKVTGE